MTTQRVRIEDLEGWLYKVKTHEKAGLFRKLTGSENKRWFRVMELPTDRRELTLCYFHKKSDRDGGAKGKLRLNLASEIKVDCHVGWVYLDDISKVSEGNGNFTLCTSSRVLILQAPTKAEHRLWLQGIAERCPHAYFENIQSSMSSNYHCSLHLIAYRY